MNQALGYQIAILVFRVVLSLADIVAVADPIAIGVVIGSVVGALITPNSTNG